MGVTEDRAGNIITVGKETGATLFVYQVSNFVTENSCDDATRTVNGQGRDVHTDNPGELVWNRQCNIFFSYLKRHLIHS